MSIINLKIKGRLVLISIALITIPLLLLGMILYSTTQNEIQLENEQKIQQQAKLISLNVQSIYDIGQQKIEDDLKVARSLLNSYGTADINDAGEMIFSNRAKEELVQKKVNSDLIVANKILYTEGIPLLSRNRTMRVSAINQISKDVDSLTIPLMLLNDKQIAFNYDLVDSIKDTTGVETATIFQKIPNGLLRISTNVMKEDNTRAVGTYIPSQSIVYKTVMKGETFYGRAYVVNAWYQTAYEPILDSRGDVIGVLYVGAKESKHIVNNDLTIVDELQSIIGGKAAIYQLKNFEGVKADDSNTSGWIYKQAFYAVSSNVSGDVGEGSLNSIVSETIYDSAMDWDSSYGRTKIDDSWYLTAYDPIIDDDGEIAGLLLVALEESDFQKSLLKNLASIVVGKTGYISIINEQGEYILSVNQSRDGDNIWNATDTDGSLFVQEMVNRGKNLSLGETDLIYYSWKNEGEKNARKKFAGFSYFPQWNWIITSGAYVDDFEDSLKRIQKIIFIVCFLGIVLGIIISNFFADSIAKPLRKVASMANKIAEGDLNIEKLTIKSKDEIRTLADSFSAMLDSFRYKADAIRFVAEGDLSQKIVKASENDQLGQSLIDMNDSLNNLMNEIKQTVGEVANGAEHVSNAGQSLSQGAVEQASSLEEITSSLNQINSQSRKNAENATEASILAKSASLKAEVGNGKMGDLLTAMDKISDSAKDISGVVKVIDDIAFQINLLALNANVEAARAGKYGKGFAVVADEVRNLAIRSADAAKETTEMMEHSGRNVSTGKKAAKDTAAQLTEILNEAVKVSDFLSEIALSSNEQAQSVEQINDGLEQIDSVTQANSSSAEESASAGEELAAQADLLKNLVDRFKLVQMYLEDDTAF